MATTNKLEISWKNDLQQSVVEKDVQNLRNLLQIIQSSPELEMKDYSLNMQVRENNL